MGKILHEVGLHADGTRASFDGMIFCPGCRCGHGINWKPRDQGPVWGFNGNFEKPTFTPSLLVKSHDFTDKGRAAHELWSASGYPKPAPEFETAPTVCHSYITDGKIQFLGDCTHALAGQTVPLEEF